MVISLWFILFLMITIVTIVIKWRAGKIKQYGLAAKLKGIPGWPVIGNALEFWLPQEKLLQHMLKLTKRDEPYPLKFWLGPKLFVYFSDVKQVEKILGSSKLSHKASIYKVLQKYLGQGLITASGVIHRKHRKFISPMFSQRHISGYIKVYEEHAKVLINMLKPLANGKEFDIYNYLHLCTVDIVYETTLGIKLSAQRNPNIPFAICLHEVYEEVFQRMIKIWLQNDTLFKLTPHYSRSKKLLNTLYDSIQKAISAKKTELKKEPEMNKEDVNDNIRVVSTLEIILNTMPDNLYSERDLLYEMVTIFLASQDTTAVQLAFLVIMLGSHPDIQDRVFEEIFSIRGDNRTPITAEEINKMEYLDMVLKETMRLFPIAPFILRQCLEDFELNDEITIPPEVTVIVGIFDIHRQPQHWERPNDFYPEHFLPKNIAKRHPMAFLPFSSGVRSCIGKLYAATTIKVLVCEFILNYRVISDRKVENLPLMTDISIRSTVGYNLRLLQRQ